MSEATIYDDLCLGCGKKQALGLFGMIEHQCPLNTVTYRPYLMLGSLSFMRMFNSMVEQLYGKPKVDILKSLLTYEYLPHFKGFPDVPKSLDELFWSHARELEIKQMKRIRAWIEIEDEFAAKY